MWSFTALRSASYHPSRLKASYYQVLKEPGYRLHVQLEAHEGIGLRAKLQDQQQALAMLANPPQTRGSNQVLEAVELLSGFVSYEQIADAMRGNKLGTRLLRKPDESVLSLRGPGVTTPPPTPFLTASPTNISDGRRMDI